MSNYHLDDLRIHELRELARQLKINAPTSKSRDELLRLIKLAKYGGLPEKYKCKNNKGRPVKGNVIIKVSDAVPLLESMYDEITKIEERLSDLKKKIKRCIE